MDSELKMLYGAVWHKRGEMTFYSIAEGTSVLKRNDTEGGPSTLKWNN